MTKITCTCTCAVNDSSFHRHLPGCALAPKILELTADMRLSDHLQPNFRRPFLNRPAKQQYANWAKGWKPMSTYGKAAKRYSRAHPAVEYRDLNGKAAAYSRWLNTQPHRIAQLEQEAEEQASRIAAYEAEGAYQAAAAYTA